MFNDKFERVDAIKTMTSIVSISSIASIASIGIVLALRVQRGVWHGFDLGLLKIENASEEAAEESAVSELFATM